MRFDLTFNETGATFDLQFGELTQGSGDFDVYEGPYTAVPKVEAQTLQTARKVCSEDIEVEGVPYLEVQNPQGGYTATIAYI